MATTRLGLYGGPRKAYEAFAAVYATTLSITVIGGENLSSLAYMVFDNQDLGAASILIQGNDASTDANGLITFDITGQSVPVGTILTAAIAQDATPSSTDRQTMLFGAAS